MAFNDVIDELGLQIRAKTDILNSRFSSAIYFTRYSKKSVAVRGRDINGDLVRLDADYNASEFMVDIHYNIIHRDFKFYPLIGVGMLYETIEVEAEDNGVTVVADDSNGELALKGGLGVQYELLHGITIYAEPHLTAYASSGITALAFHFGLMYAF